MKENENKVKEMCRRAMTQGSVNVTPAQCSMGERMTFEEWFKEEVKSEPVVVFTLEQVIGLVKTAASLPDSLYDDEHMPDWIKENS